MPDTYRKRALELRARAANECGPARKYFRGLASSYEMLARERGEWPERPQRPKRPKRLSEPSALMAERARLTARLRDSGYSQRRIAKELGVCQQLVSRILQGLAGVGRYQRLAALRPEQETTSLETMCQTVPP
jgi:hypothetical protein